MRCSESQIGKRNALGLSIRGHFDFHGPVIIQEKSPIGVGILQILNAPAIEKASQCL